MPNLKIDPILYPNLSKFLAHRQKAALLQEFLAYCTDRGLTMCSYDLGQHDYTPERNNLLSDIGAFLGFDYQAVFTELLSFIGKEDGVPV